MYVNGSFVTNVNQLCVNLAPRLTGQTWKRFHPIAERLYANRKMDLQIFIFASILYLFFLVNGNWGEWTAYGRCSVSCGGGQNTRLRLCDNPAPSGGGDKCQGDSKESLICFTQACPGKTILFLTFLHIWKVVMHASSVELYTNTQGVSNKKVDPLSPQKNWFLVLLCVNEIPCHNQ